MIYHYLHIVVMYHFRLMDATKTTPVTRRKMEIVEIQMRQIQSMKAKIQFICENADAMVEAMEEKARTTQIEYLNDENIDPYKLWRGASIDQYMLNNLFSGRYSDSGEYISEVRRDMEKVA